MPEHLFVIIPSLLPTGPVKGAVALCNGLVNQLAVTLVVLKASHAEGVHIVPEIQLLSLAHLDGWRKKAAALRDALEKAGGRTRVASISFCFSADMINYFMKRYAIIAASVRGNLPQNYRFDYGPLGQVAAWMHLFALHRFDRVVAMSNSMATQLRRFGLKRLAVIGNFVDEETLETYRYGQTSTDKSTVRFLFLASLSRRKRPELLLAAANELNRRGLDFHIELAGAGPLEQMLREQVECDGLASQVTFHGQLVQPFTLLQQVDYLVLPSESEGIPRAGLEALFFGVPCILRDVDANHELVRQGYNGELYREDGDLPRVMARAIEEVGKYRQRRNLLPSQFRQQTNVENYLQSLSL